MNLRIYLIISPLWRSAWLLIATFYRELSLLCKAA